MPFCTHCGTEYAAGTSFCGSCGRPVGTAAPDADVAEETTAYPVPPASATRPPIPPPAFAGHAVAAGSATPVVDWRRIVTGNWLGAAMVALATGVTAGLLATVVALLAKPVDFGLDNSLTLVAWLMTGAFGAGLDIDISVMGFDAHASLAAMSVTILLASLAVGVVVFRRVTAGYTRAVDAMADATRAALLFGAGMLVVALVFRSDSRQFGRGWGAELSHMFDTRLAFGPSAVGAFFLSLLMLLVVLLATCWLREDWWGPRVQRARDWLAAPLYGVGVFGLLLPVAGLIGLVLVMATGDTVQDTDPTDDDTSALIGLIFALLASGGLWVLGLGSGVSLGSHGHDSQGSTGSDTYHLGHYADDAWGLWLAPLVMLGVMYVSALAVARRAGPGRVLPSLVTWVGAVLVTTPFWVLVTSLHASISERKEGYSGSGVIGVDGLQTTLLLTLAAVVVALLVALQRGALDAATLRTHARTLGQKIQTNPARPPASE